MPTTTNTLRLKDGRQLAFAEYGDPRGKPLFYFHGFPGSRLEAELADATARRRGIRVIAFDRPGFGKSTSAPKRSLAGWADDIAEAAEQLGIDRFAVMGVSGGGPYAAACAARIPHRLTSVALASALGPLNVAEAVRGYRLLSRLFIRLWRWLPWLTRPGLWLLGRTARRRPERIIELGRRSAPPADRAVLERAEVRDAMARSVQEAFRQGSRAAAIEFRLYLKPWDFDLSKIATAVHLWQGEEDRVVPPSMGRYLAKVIPTAQARFCPNEGHSLALVRLDEIHEALFPGSA